MIAVELFEGLNPLCVAWVVMDRTGFERLAEVFLRALASPPPSDDPTLPDSVLQTVASQQEALRQWLDARGINSEALLAPPLMEGAQAYCPRCKVEYLREEGGCSSCDGVPLIPSRQGEPLGYDLAKVMEKDYPATGETLKTAEKPKAYKKR